jgi:hypothetical protein
MQETAQSLVPLVHFWRACIRVETAPDTFLASLAPMVQLRVFNDAVNI